MQSTEAAIRATGIQLSIAGPASVFTTMAEAPLAPLLFYCLNPGLNSGCFDNVYKQHLAYTSAGLNVAKIPYRRVGFAHQNSFISSVKDGQSPPCANDAAIHHG
jgi:hypothetical protein